MSTDLRPLLPELIPSGCESHQPGCPGWLQDLWEGRAGHPCSPQPNLGVQPGLCRWEVTWVLDGGS